MMAQPISVYNNNNNNSLCLPGTTTGSVSISYTPKTGREPTSTQPNHQHSTSPNVPYPSVKIIKCDEDHHHHFLNTPLEFERLSLLNHNNNNNNNTNCWSVESATGASSFTHPTTNIRDSNDARPVLRPKIILTADVSEGQQPATDSSTAKTTELLKNPNFPSSRMESQNQNLHFNNRLLSVPQNDLRTRAAFPSNNTNTV